MIDLSKVPDLIKNIPTSDTEIQEVEDIMGIKLPNVYKNLLRYTNGFSIGGGLTIYGTQDIVERNRTWDVAEYASGYVSIGDDGGGNVFLMLQGAEERVVLVVGSGDMNPNHAIPTTLDFIKWVNNGCLSETVLETIDEPPDTCNIMLIGTPTGGVKDLVKIRGLFGNNISTADLLKGSRNPPFILAEKFPYGKAKKLIEKLGPIGIVLKLIPESK